MRGLELSPEKRFEALLHEVLSPAYKHARYLTGEETEAQDLLQEAVLLALKGFKTFRPGTNFRAWFLRVLVNAFYMRLRKERRSTRDVSFNEAVLHMYPKRGSLNGSSSNGADNWISELTVRQITAAIQSLPPDYRVAASLYFLEDLSYQEIAAILECPVGTVRSRLHRGRRLLQASLRQVAEEHGIVRARADSRGR